MMRTGDLPEDQNSATWKIWNKLFLCRIPYLQSMSPDYIRHFGIPISGDPVRDRAVTSEVITTMVTIAKMLEYFSKGVTVRIVKSEDTKEIYEYISDHLSAWKRQLEVGLNNRNAPIEDLLLMDKFANAVYAHAKYHLTEEFMEGVVARQMLGAMRVNRNTLFTYRPGDPPPKATPEGEADAGSKLPERQSLADVFASRRATARPRWR